MDEWQWKGRRIAVSPSIRICVSFKVLWIISGVCFDSGVKAISVFSLALNLVAVDNMVMVTIPVAQPIQSASDAITKCLNGMSA